MKPEHYASVIRLNAEIIDIQEVIAGWLGITDPNRFKEAASQLIVLKDKLASLRMERKAFLDDV
jgi:hypothetical protein